MDRRYNNNGGYQQDNYNHGAQHHRREEWQDQQDRRAYRQSPTYGRHGGEQGKREDYYNEMYDISNYSGIPRDEDYGLPHGAENELMSIKPMPLQEGPYYGRQRYNYNLGYNPNFDNPEEGDMYRDFDSRGNYGYRHDASYGNADEFRDFGDDHYGSQDRTNRPYRDNQDRFNRH